MPLTGVVLGFCLKNRVTCKFLCLAFAQGFGKKTGKTSFTQFVVLAPVLQGLYCLLANKFADSQSNPHNRPKAYELIKANNPGLSSTPA